MGIKIRINLSINSVKKLNEEMTEIRKLSKFKNEKIIVNAEIEQDKDVVDVSKSLYKHEKLLNYQGVNKL